MRRRRIWQFPFVTTLIVVAALSTGCGHSAAPGPTTTSTSSTAPQPTSSTTPATSAPANPDSGVSQGQTYGITIISIDGATPDNRGRWHGRAAQLSGGDPRVADAFNNASRASANGQIEPVRAAADPDAEWLLELNPTLTFRPTAIAELIVGVYSARHAAHPTNSVSTIAIDSRTAKPITLADLFRNQQDGLNRLAEQTKIIFPQVYGGSTPDEEGTRPIADNFANWIPTSAGMELHFNDYQFGHGLPVITVPWSALTDVLAPDMLALTHD
ncbi:hypothetical protein A9X01_27270 [Mycobacterium asiaticum]|uniref:DUF3298 domain-containing protein n=1 Tax=Mycobacterium asiaticum TaxID=1790 RepID=A0A1A3BUF8_MYCAS|nr:hypothetical protein A9X01_27270 [Mycobacterium asiaticum]